MYHMCKKYSYEVNRPPNDNRANIKKRCVGQMQGMTSKKVVNQQVLRRHFDYTLPSSEENVIMQLQRDKVVFHRNEMKQVTLFTKCDKK